MPAGWPRRLAVATITIGLMMSVLSNSMTNLALPYIAQDLNITAESSIWIVNATQIALIVSLLPVAALADIVGYRHVYRFGLVLFSLASIGCALRAVAALAAARRAPSRGWAARPSCRSSRRWCARSIRATSWAAASASTPPWSRPRSPPAPRSARRCSSITSWPILFAVYVPLGIISFVLSERYLPHTTHTHRPFDVLSAVLSGVTFGLLIFGIDGMAHGHQRPVIVCRARRWPSCWARCSCGARSGSPIR